MFNGRKNSWRDSWHVSFFSFYHLLTATPGRENLSGAANYWSMVIALRPFFFQVCGLTLAGYPCLFLCRQCGAAIFQLCPKSALFKLPAFAAADVQNWMATTFRTDITLLRAKEGSPLDLERIQNYTLRLALEELRTLVVTQTSLIIKLNQTIERRTAVLSPTQGFSQEMYCKRSKFPLLHVVNLP